MKSILIKLSILVLTVSMATLTGCSTNTQKQNTALGAVSGGVIGGLAGSAIGAGTGQVVAIGLGAVAGALIGGAVGHNMESSDATNMNQAMDNNPPHKRTHWKNKHTQTSYMVVPTSKMMSVNGNPNCREYRTITTTDDGKKQETNGVACRQTNGNWTKVKA